MKLTDLKDELEETELGWDRSRCFKGLIEGGLF